MKGWILLLALLLPVLAEASLLDKQAEKRVEADRWFTQEKYAPAMTEYLALAKAGDKFAQYRLALMYYFALGTDKNILESAAWAAVAQEQGIPVLQKLATLLLREVPQQQQAELLSRIAALDQAYGSTPEQHQNRMFNKPRSCTGSRVGSACDRIESFGVIGRDQGNYRTYNTANQAMSEEDISDFNRRYGQAILAEFDRYDGYLVQQPNQSTGQRSAASGLISH
ncbi:MAG: hypothetical protein Tsb002_25960 [Wenzhouxiangellaceae bacterium]